MLYNIVSRAYEEKRACNSQCKLRMRQKTDESAGYAIFSQPPTRGGWSRLIKIHVSLCFLCKNSKLIQAAESAHFIYFLPLACYLSCITCPVSL